MKIKLTLVALLFACALPAAASAQRNTNTRNGNGANSNSANSNGGGNANANANANAARENNNNRRPQRPLVLNALPDLAFKSEKFIETAGETRAVIVVTNQGKGASQMCRIRLNVLKGMDKDSPVEKLWETDIPPLKPGEDATITIDIAPSTFVGKSRTVILDFTNKVKESDESNNFSFSNFPPQGFK